MNLLGRLVGVAGDVVRAIALQRVVLRLRPDHPRAAEDLQTASSAIRSPTDAQIAFRRAIDQEPDIGIHHRHPGSLEPFVRMDIVQAALENALALDPSHALAQAALGNLHARLGRYASALDAYSVAVMLDPNLPAVHLAVAELLELVHDRDAARHRELALVQKRFYPAGAVSKNAQPRVLVLMAPGARSNMNAPLDFLVNHTRIALHRYYVRPNDPFDFSDSADYDVIFTAIDENESSREVIETCAKFIASQSAPALNLPQYLAGTARSVLGETLGGVAGCVVAQTRRVSRALLESISPTAQAIDGIAFPLLLRPVDTHSGIGLQRLSEASEINEYLQRFSSAHFNVATFEDYRSADGFYRKYRVIVIDGKPFAYHLAISPEWMVHYLSSPMLEHVWMREEEGRFLDAPDSVFANWNELFAKMAAAIGLDYFGVDCTLLEDGRVLIFEAGPAML
ncbi:MAG: tetratricopeptide repeat protein, partial [Candidatus Eremiobacteraeota bacterium]|nr:tetratricopeptide repeat protein [Candidatus Eremiobacteraeota bacterium]